MNKVISQWGLLKPVLSAVSVLFLSAAFLWLKPGVEQAREDQATYASLYKSKLFSSKQELLAQLAANLKDYTLSESVNLDMLYSELQFDDRLWEKQFFEELSSLGVYELHFRSHDAFIWVSDVDGNFRGGLPAATFSALNTAFDQHEPLIARDGFYKTRNGFLGALVDEIDLIDFSVTEEGNKPAYWRFSEANTYMNNQHGSGKFLLSETIKNSEGRIIGTLFMKLDDSMNRYIIYSDAGTELLKDYKRYVYLIRWATILFIWFWLPSWVYTDATNRKVAKPVAWGLITLFSSAFGLAIYLASRPQTVARNVCASCVHFIPPNSTYCPYCGIQQTLPECPSCERHIEEGWIFCPSCRLPLTAELFDPPPRIEANTN